MTVQWTAKEVALATGGRTDGIWAASSVSIDTRTMEPGALFVALPGAKVDGHDHVQAALAAGAAGALVSRAIEGVDAAKLVLVADVEQALQALGRAARARSEAKFIGVTGSVGKTGAKEMLAAALAPLGKTYATKGNLNNHLGVPLTLCNLPSDTQFAIIEMGMNHVGEIAPLSAIARPDVSLITTVEAVHLEHFGAVEAIADEKAEIFSGMGGAGYAVLNMDNAHFARLKQHAERHGLDRVLGFGTDKGAICRMTDYRVSETGSQVEATIAGTSIAYRIGTVGKHWAVASVAVLGVVDALGGDLAKSAAVLEHFREPKGRGRIEQLTVKGGKLTLVDDSYNASPVSVAGAISKVAELKRAAKEPVRTLVVLGDMLELGDTAEELHVGLIPAIINNQMDLVFAAGSFMQKMYDALPEGMKGAYRATAKELAPVVVDAIRPHDLVLVKGSRGSRMEIVVDAIKESADAV